MRKVAEEVDDLRAVALDAIDATPARWRGDAGSSPLDGASTAASSPRNDLVKNCRVHPTHWLVSTQVRSTIPIHDLSQTGAPSSGRTLASFMNN